MSLWDDIAEHIGRETGEPFVIRETSQVGGGCINSSCRLSDGKRRVFVKTNTPENLAMFEAEVEALREMAATDTLKVPVPICTGVADGAAYVVMENLEFQGRDAQDRLGTLLAQMHGHRSDRFGWHRDNVIGSTHQPNGWDSDWLHFWRENRLGFQLSLAEKNGIGGGVIEKGERLKADMAGLFQEHQPEPSLLHGDLWGGNYATTVDGEPAIFDPATYYGDREAEIAMTELFGGFTPAFYDAYNEAWSLDPGYDSRKLFYNLYHVLNHFNLFGGGYGAQADAMLDRLLGELRG